MSRNVRRRNNVGATFKDYLVPIVGGFFILILIYSFFSGSDTPGESNIEGENKIPAEISFGDINTEAFIEYPGEVKEKITGSTQLYKGEKVIVKGGNILLQSPEGSNINLNKIAELKYLEDGNYALYSSDAWFTLNADTQITMSYANVNAPAGSIIALTQNEATSTVYVISGSAKVSNLVGVNTLIISGQKVSVSRQNSRNEDADLSSEKSNIDSYFKGSDWFIENNGHVLLEQATNEEKTSDETATENEGSTGKYISFNNLSDEMSAKTSSLDITGNILSDFVSSVTINNKQVSIKTDKSFTLNGLSLTSNVNDIVVKIYDSNKDIIEKSVYTVYASTSQTNSIQNTATTTNANGVTTYEVDATEFAFTEPSVSGKFSTTGSEITIRGKTTAEGITKVQVNGFTLSSFNGSTWRYHAFERFETLEAGTNQYKIDYFGEDGSIVYTDYFTIVKKSAQAVTTPTSTETPQAEENTISNEASISG